MKFCPNCASLSLFAGGVCGACGHKPKPRREITETRDTQARVDVGKGEVTAEVFGIQTRYMGGSFLTLKPALSGDCVIDGLGYRVFAEHRGGVWKTLPLWKEEGE